ncbi:MAG TPA: molybdopterin-dependent oxidoreductase, partial [Spirochaetota bacterium]|nr:molybdopterin-dependent oxidoreductase [Spirochaetota bacterium]
MNRRDFLKLSAAFGAAFAAGGVPYVFNRISPSKKLRFAEKIPSLCLYCSVQCRVNNYRKNGRFISIKGENSSALCPRGLSIPGILNSSESGFKIKRKNSSSWENISINDAVEFSATKIKEIRDRDFQSTENGFIVNNLKTIASVMGSSLSNEEAYYITKFMRTLGILYHGSETLLSHDSASECLKDAFGLSASHTDIESIDDSCVMLIFGADIAMNNPSLVPHILKAKKKGTFIICVDPVSTYTSSLADIHVRIAPGTDYFFLGALINYLLKNSFENKEFLLNHTDASFITDSILGGAYRLDERGYPESDDSLRKDNSVLSLLSKEFTSYTPEAAVSTCGIDAGIFLAVSEKISMCNGKTKFLSSVFGGSFCDNSRGFSSAWLLSVLHILGGNVSLPNAGIVWLKSGGNEQGVFDFAPGW